MPDEQEVTVDAMEIDVETFEQVLKDAEEEKEPEELKADEELRGDVKEKELPAAEVEPEDDLDGVYDTYLEREPMYTFHSSELYDPNKLSKKGMMVLGCVFIIAGGIVAAILGALFSK